MVEHVLKTLPRYFDAIWRGERTFDIRRNDRAYQVGDVLILVQHTGSYSDCQDLVGCLKFNTHPHTTMRCTVSYVFSGDPSLLDLGGVVPGYVVLGLSLQEDLT